MSEDKLLRQPLAEEPVTSFVDHREEVVWELWMATKVGENLENTKVNDCR